MWSKELQNHYSISVEERQELSEKLLTLMKSHGQVFNVLARKKDRDIAFMQYNEFTHEVALYCGSFWNEADNLCPIIAMCHELGHSYDLRTNFGNYYPYYSGTLGVLGLELRAWEYAFEFLKEIGLREELMKVAYEYAEHCLGTYYNYPFPHDLDVRFDFMGESPTWHEAKNRLRKIVGLNPIHEPEQELDKFQKFKMWAERI